MPDYGDYSKTAFDDCNGDKSKILRLLDQLDREIQTDIHQCVASRMREIALELNARGHELKRNVELEEPGTTDYCETHGADTCGFRVAIDIVISLGYYGVWRDDPDSRDDE